MQSDFSFIKVLGLDVELVTKTALGQGPIDELLMILDQKFYGIIVYL